MIDCITLQEAIAMITRYRQYKKAAATMGEGTLPVCETFDAVAIAKILATEGCEFIRIYYGMSENLHLHAIIVAAGADGADILPVEEGPFMLTTDADIIKAFKICPPGSLPPSPLNS